MVVLLGFDEESLMLQLLHDALAGFEAVDALEIGWYPPIGQSAHPAILRHDQRLLLLGPRPTRDLEVVGVVCRRYLQQPSAEALFHRVVARNRDDHPGERNLYPLPLERSVATVLRIEHEPDIAEHRLGTRRRDRHEPRPVLQRIPDVIEIALGLVVLRLFIGQRRETMRAPMDLPRAALEQSLTSEA